MPTRMALWRFNADGSAEPVAERPLSAEAQIESAVESQPDLLGMDVLIIGRQTQTPSGPLDLLAIDSEGALVVIENKRDRTPREVLAQAIDYAAWVNSLTFEEVSAHYALYRQRHGESDVDLAEAFEERFGEELDALTGAPKIVIVASRLDDSTERMIEFLSESFDVPVNAALFQPFEGGLVGRTWLRPEVITARSAGRRSASRSASRDQAQRFWDAFLPIGRPVLPDIRLPENGQRSVFIKRRIIPGIPASLSLWVATSDAYAEVQFGDEDPAVNQAMLDHLERHRDQIEANFGGELDWRGLGASAARVRRTKVVSPKVEIGERASPDENGLRRLAETARRLVDATKPHLQECFDAVTTALAADDEHG